ncbi:hypothetical protein ACMT4L_07840 [Deinococcus sp. A31D244]|uniref:hypothetical protein n=1 Tax=Deinococcus sp. A31D244 TaxID=3397675 RepID=UPI0039E123E2
MLARARSVALIGVDAVPVEVEVDVSPGLPAFTIQGSDCRIKGSDGGLIGGGVMLRLGIIPQQHKRSY